MWWMLAAGALAGGLPTVEVSWKNDDAVLRVGGPPGEHVAEEAGASMTLAWGSRELSFGGLGRDVVRGVSLQQIRGERLEGTVHVSLCQDGGTLCRFVDADVSGDVPVDKKGLVVLTIGSGEPDLPAEPYQQDARTVAAGAFERAASRSVPVLLDFTGVWCPPCNLLSAEILRDPQYKDLLWSYEFAQVDVDDPSSWDIKDRYDVTGYPTLLVATPAGAEVARLVGYPGREQTVSFLTTMATQADPDQAAETLDPVTAGERAWALVVRGRDDIGELLAIAAAEPDHVSFRLARMSVAPTVEDATWLADHAPGTAVLWIWGARDLAATPEGKAVLVRAIQADLPTARPSDAADLLSVQAEFSEPSEARTLYLAAAHLLEGSLTGDPVGDKGYLTALADLKAEGGDLAGALKVLDSASVDFPKEPTWALTAARLLLDAERPADALARAEAAMPLAWGDNRLRLVRYQVLALMALGRAEDARALATKTLAEEPAPPEGTDVRTHRYRAQLSEAAGL